MEPQNPAPEPFSLRVLLRLFLIPLVVVAACVGVYFLFGLITGEGKDAGDYLVEIRAGTATRRWQAAYELASLLANRTPEEWQETDLVPDLIRLLEDPPDDDPRVRRYLALALGRLADRRGTGVLQGLLDDDDGETVIYALWALGNIADPGTAPALTAALHHPDPGIRKMAAHSLGRLGRTDTVPALRDALEDPEIDVTWNAALALSRLGDRRSADLLTRMVDRTYLDNFAGVDADRQDEIIINAIRGLGLLGIPETRDLLLGLSREDPSTRVRGVALEALERFPPSPPP